MGYPAFDNSDTVVVTRATLKALNDLLQDVKDWKLPPGRSFPLTGSTGERDYMRGQAAIGLMLLEEVLKQ